MPDHLPATHAYGSNRDVRGVSDDRDAAEARFGLGRGARQA